MRKILFISFLIFNLTFLIILSGCSDRLTVSSITVTPASSSVGVNKTQQFYATAYSPSGTVISASFTWSISSSIGGSISSGGLFTAGSTTGTVEVRATSGGVTGTTTASIVTTGSVAGTVKDSSGNAVGGIGVSLTSVPTLSAFSNSSGEYSISGITPGTYEVKTNDSILYVSITIEATVATGEVASGNITLIDRISLVSESFGSNPVSVSGKVKNNGTTTATSVTVIYTFYDSEGNLEGAGQANLGDIAAQGTSDFNVFPTPVISSYSTFTRNIAASGY